MRSCVVSWTKQKVTINLGPRNREAIQRILRPCLELRPLNAPYPSWTVSSLWEVHLWNKMLPIQPQPHYTPCEIFHLAIAACSFPQWRLQLLSYNVLEDKICSETCRCKVLYFFAANPWTRFCQGFICLVPDFQTNIHYKAIVDYGT